MAVLALNTLLLLLATNLIIWVIDRIAGARQPTIHPVLRTFSPDLVRRAYPDLSEQQMRDLLAESFGRPLSFEPFTQFKETARQGQYVNVAPGGFRDNGAGATAPWPPDPAAFNVFVFGGSTTFGYGLPDDQTIPARLREALPGTPAVYNFGRGNYFSSQERVLFEQLLVAGHAPDVAIFIDGVNEFMHLDGAPSGSDRLARAYTVPPVTSDVMNLLMRLPLGRLVGLARSRAGRESGQAGSERSVEESAARAEPGALDEVISRYFANTAIIEAIANARGIRTVFVWQPAPNYKYDDAAYHLFRTDSYGSYASLDRGYARMADRLATSPPVPTLLWLADIQEQLREPLYVDRIHYNAEFSRLLAEEIADFVTRNGSD